MAEDTPIKDAAIPITSGVEDIVRAEAAGIISIAIISNTPTTLMPTATTMAKETVKIKDSFLGLKPFAAAKSSFNVTNKSGDHLHIIRDKIIPAPAHIKRRSKRDTANISPIKYAIKSIRMPDMKETITSPAAIALCPATPSSVSKKRERPS